MDLKDVSEVDLPWFAELSNMEGKEGGGEKWQGDAIAESGKKEWLQLGGVWALGMMRFRWRRTYWSRFDILRKQSSSAVRPRFVNLQPASVTMAVDKVMGRGWGAVSREILKEDKGQTQESHQYWGYDPL